MPEEGVAEKHSRTDKSDIEVDTCTEAGGETGTSQSHSQYKKGHMTNIYFRDSDEEAIVDIVKEHKELYDKTNDRFKDKVGSDVFDRGLPIVTTCL